MKTLVIIAFALVSTLSISAKSAKAVEVNAKSVMSTQVYNYVNDDNEFVKYEYALDSNNRVIAKTCYHWSSLSNDWEPAYIYKAVYGETENTLLYAKWDESKKSFSKSCRQQSFGKDVNELLSLPANE